MDVRCFGCLSGRMIVLLQLYIIVQSYAAFDYVWTSRQRSRLIHYISRHYYNYYVWNFLVGTVVDVFDPAHPWLVLFFFNLCVALLFLKPLLLLLPRSQYSTSASQASIVSTSTYISVSSSHIPRQHHHWKASICFRSFLFIVQLSLSCK